MDDTARRFFSFYEYSLCILHRTIRAVRALRPSPFVGFSATMDSITELSLKLLGDTDGPTPAR